MENLAFFVVIVIAIGVIVFVVKAVNRNRSSKDNLSGGRPSDNNKR